MKNICASCHGVDVKNIIKTDNEKLPEWLQKTDYVSNFIENAKIKAYKQQKTNMKLILNAGEKNKNKYILYWGAEPQKNILIKDAKTAYKNFKNYGVTKVNQKEMLHFILIVHNRIVRSKKVELNEKHFIDTYIFVFQIINILIGYLLYIQRLLFVTYHYNKHNKYTKPEMLY